MPPAAPSDPVVAKILRWNRRCDARPLRIGLTLTAFTVSLAALAYSTHRNPGFNTAPPIGGDAVIYDALGWALAAGDGFSLDLQDPEFLAPYRHSDPAGAEKLAHADLHGPIASRPPLLPLILAGCDRMLGRQFRGLRAINVLALATVAAMLVWTVARLAGPIPAMIGFVNFLIVDPRIRVTAREFLTEALACLLVAMLTVTLVRIAERPRLRTALLIGGILGTAILLRTMFVFWIPCLAVAIWISTRRANLTPGRRVGLLAGLVIVACAVVSPWAMRNGRILDRAMPLGTQGTMELSAGYSDAAFERLGMWHNLEETNFFATTDQPGQSTLEREIARADQSRDEAFAWCRAHPLKAVCLPAMKVFQEFRPHMSGDLYILAFALLGLLAMSNTPDGRAWIAILAATAFGVALTWSTAGRFVVPSLFPLHAAAAIGIWKSVQACIKGNSGGSPVEVVAQSHELF